jgi:hypothetical protein
MLESSRESMTDGFIKRTKPMLVRPTTGNKSVQFVPIKCPCDSSLVFFSQALYLDHLFIFRYMGLFSEVAPRMIVC